MQNKNVLIYYRHIYMKSQFCMNVTMVELHNFLLSQKMVKLLRQKSFAWAQKIEQLFQSIVQNMIHHNGGPMTRRYEYRMNSRSSSFYENSKFFLIQKLQIIHGESGLCMQSNQTDVILNTCNSNDARFQWKFTSTDLKRVLIETP